MNGIVLCSQFGTTSLRLNEGHVDGKSGISMALFIGFFLCFVLAMIALSVVMWLRYKDPVFIYYWSFVVAVGVAQSTTFGIHLIWEDTGLFAQLLTPTRVVPLTSVLCPLFAIALLKGVVTLKDWRVWGVVLILLVSVLVVVVFRDSTLYDATNTIAAISASFTLVIGFSLLSYDRVAGLRFIIVWVVFIIGTVGFVLADSGLLGRVELWVRVMNLGSMLAMSVILFVLYSRIRQNQFAIVQAQEFSNELLERYESDGVEVRKLSSKGELLRSQMNPHFLYNSLASIQTFVLDNDKLASAGYLARYSRLMRAYLKASRTDVIPLYEEVELLEDYLCLCRLESGNKLNYNVSVEGVDDITEIEIPPFLVQPLVENCLKHAFKGLGRRDWSVRVKFHLVGTVLLVEVVDNGVGLIRERENESRESYALQILKERIEVIKAQELFQIKFELVPNRSSNGTTARVELFPVTI